MAGKGSAPLKATYRYRIVDLLEVALSRGCESLPADLLRQIEGYGMAAARACEVYSAIRANRVR